MKISCFHKLIFGLFSLFILSCETEINSPPSLFAEEVLYLSGEQVRLLARVISNQEINATDHGFFIADNEGFSSHIVISLGAKARPGRFIGENSGLKTESTYFAKAFVTINGSQIFSNTISFQTLATGIFQIVPNNGRPGDIVEILGKNFSSDTKVFFGQNEAEIINISFESRIRVRVPAASGKSMEPVKLISGNMQVGDPLTFEYTTGTYRKLENNFPVPKLYDNIHFQHNGDFFVGLGILNNFAANPKIWRYNPSLRQWDEAPFQGNALGRAFSAGNYFGGGSMGSSNNLSNDFYKFDQGNFKKLSNLPFQGVNSLAFMLNNALYVGGGSIGTGRQLFRYDENSGIWELKGVLPFMVTSNTVHFGDGQRHFFIDPDTKLIFSFNGNNDDIISAGIFPGALTEDSGFGVVLNDKAYMGLSANTNKIYEWDLKDYSWKIKNDFVGHMNAETIAVYTKNNLIYILRSPLRTSPFSIEFWEFDPLGF